MVSVVEFLQLLAVEFLQPTSTALSKRLSLGQEGRVTPFLSIRQHSCGNLWGGGTLQSRCPVDILLHANTHEVAIQDTSWITPVSEKPCLLSLLDDDHLVSHSCKKSAISFHVSQTIEGCLGNCQSLVWSVSWPLEGLVWNLRSTITSTTIHV